ncbi:unnamed protein product [Albugo candida]|uniref:Uncharacterized protein n=1 Tax=Albugo candida TaxID=65357 RepID=A0A024G1X4_9STRA|nr:unnamed protein product [Albugo candida]|eukprot:CCI40838.1 unnamed protein product [Albugo candida]
MTEMYRDRILRYTLQLYRCALVCRSIRIDQVVTNYIPLISIDSFNSLFLWRKDHQNALLPKEYQLIRPSILVSSKSIHFLACRHSYQHTYTYPCLDHQTLDE